MPSETRNVAILEVRQAIIASLLVPTGRRSTSGSSVAVGNAEWTGVPLVALLERADMEEDACETRARRS